MNIIQDIADAETALSFVDFGDRLDRFYPARRIRRYVDRLLMIVFDTTDRLVQRAMQCRVVGQVLTHGVINAVELAFDDPFLGFAPGSK